MSGLSYSQFSSVNSITELYKLGRDLRQAGHPAEVVNKYVNQRKRELLSADTATYKKLEKVVSPTAAAHTYTSFDISELNFQGEQMVVDKVGGAIKIK